MKSFAKVNIFLKITGKRDNYHTLFSRFMIVKNLYDTIDFKKNDTDTFCIDGNFSCALEKNTIYKAYSLLKQTTNNKDIEQFFKSHKIVIDKNIPEFAGLGGGSANASTFLKMINEELNLKLTIEQLCDIGKQIGADVPFFLYDYDSANVSGVGEIVKPYKENALDITTFTPQIQCDTPSVYKKFRSDFYKEYKNEKYLENISSLDYLAIHSIAEANDLYLPALALYPNLKNHQKDDWFFSGSGSSFFMIEKKL